MRLRAENKKTVWRSLAKKRKFELRTQPYPISCVARVRDKKAGSEGESTFRKSSHSLPATLPVLLLGYQSLRMNKTGETKGTRKHTQQVWYVKHIRYSRWEKAGGCQHSQETMPFPREMEVPGNGANNEASLCRVQESLGTWRQGGNSFMKIDWNLGYLNPSPIFIKPGTSRFIFQKNWNQGTLDLMMMGIAWGQRGSLF